MKQSQLYKFATWGLLALNLFLIVFLSLRKGPPPGREPANDFSRQTIELLELDQEQNRNFLQMAREHDEQMRAISRKQAEVLKPYFDSLLDPTQVVDEEKLFGELAQLEREKIKLTYGHFQDVKLMLNDQQKIHFERFMERALEIILIKSKKNQPPPKDF